MRHDETDETDGADDGRPGARGASCADRRHAQRAGDGDTQAARCIFPEAQGIEASINTLLLTGLGLIALTRAEATIKQKRVFRDLHGLRSLIHVIDMHQLTKDPAALSANFKPTAHSPARITNAADLARYLDYCSEMLSITGKIAALFAQSVNDDVVIDGVNDIENLASNLSRKIWQKITLIENHPAAQPVPAPGPAGQAAPLRPRAPKR